MAFRHRYLYRMTLVPGRAGDHHAAAPRKPPRAWGPLASAVFVFAALVEPCEKERVQPASAATGNAKFRSRFRFPSFRACSAGLVLARLPRLEPCWRRLCEGVDARGATLEGCAHPRVNSKVTAQWCSTTLWGPSESFRTEVDVLFHNEKNKQTKKPLSI